MKKAKKNAMDAYFEKLSSSKNTLSMGQVHAYRAWAKRESYSGNDLVIDDLLFDSDRADFANTLAEAGCKAFITLDSSTALMGTLHDFAALGWVFDGLCTVIKKDAFFSEYDKEIQGIRLVRK